MLSVGHVPVVKAATFLTLERRVAASADDAEEFIPRGTTRLASDDLELIHDSYDQVVGIRWTALTIPPGSTITAAYVQFASKEAQSEVTNLTLRAQAADNAPAFASGKFNVSSRTRTTASASWSPVAWTAGEVGANQRTPDLKGVIQEVLSRPGWASGNALALIVTGTGHRTAWSFDGSATGAPLLHIDYVPPEHPPTAALSVSQAASPPLTVSADGSGSTDVDLTPIASYRFNFGDGTIVTTTAPTATAQHTYSDAATYTVTLTVTDTGNNPSTPVSQSITVNPPPADDPPVASLVVTQLASPPLTVRADGSGSTDTDVTPIGSYQFDFGDGTIVNTTAPTAVAQHTYAAAGPYTVTLTATDTNNQTSTPVAQNITVSSSSSSGATIEKRVAASTDDAEERADASMYLTSSDLELIHDATDQTVGIRWAGLAIPAGASITAAYVQFAANEAQSEATNLTLRAQAADNAATFGSTAGDVSTRSRTSSSVSWAPAAWLAGDAGAAQRTPDLSAVIQEVVSRPGWASGNALTLIVTGSGHRTAWAYDGSPTLAPLLHIEFLTTPPPENPPVARLSVTQLSSPAFTVKADGSASSDVDATPIATYRFDFGDGSVVTTNAPTATAQHTYSGAGTRTITLRCTDTGGSPSALASVNFNVSSTTGPPVAVYAGYYDTHHPVNLRTKPDPWQGSPNVVFVGTPDDPKAGGWDSSALRIDNLSGNSLTVTATVDVGSKHFDLWGARTIPVGNKLILAQTGFENFDGSDLNAAGCYSCNPNDCLTKVSSTIPVIHVTVNGTTTNYSDVGQVINTQGADLAGCPYTGTRNDESTPWTQINPSSAPAAPAGQAAQAGQEGVEEVAGPTVLFAPYPNPARGVLTIDFKTPRRGEVRLAVYDLAGRMVRPSVDGILDGGQYRDVMNLNGLAPGIYFCRLTTPEGVLHRAFTLIR